jgi:hypothetical protein
LSQLVLNISPIKFDDAEMSVGVLQYKDKEHVKSLRNVHRSTHIFLRSVLPQSEMDYAAV